jgi:hypothetical protein
MPKTRARVGVMCAYNPHNSGMYSVDLSARQYFTALGVDHELCVSQNRTRVGVLRYRLVRSANDLRHIDTLVYWGDFQNNPMWGRREYPQRERRQHGVTDPEQGFDNWRELYLRIGDQLPASTRVLSVGGCFIGMEAGITGPDVADEVRGFLRRASAVVVRDPLSHRTLTSFDPTAPSVALGFDCASLLQASPPAQRRGPYFAYSFSRSLAPEAAREVVDRTERETGWRGVAIDWLRRRGSRHLVHPRFRLNLMLMRHAQFCLTDTYHFAINSLTQGTLPICVVRQDVALNSTLNEAKKAALMQMVGLDEAVLPLPGEPLSAVSPDDLRAAADRAVAASSQIGRRAGWRDGFVERRDDLRRQLCVQFT